LFCGAKCFVALKIIKVIESIARIIRLQLKFTPLKTNLVTYTLVLIFCDIVSYFYKVWLVSVLIKSLACFFSVPCLYFFNSCSFWNVRLSELFIFCLDVLSAFMVLFNKEASRIGILT
jgi:hypothetical protein